MTTILLLLGTGCAPTYTDQYTAMEAVCHWDDYTAEVDAEAPWAVWYPTMDYAAFPSEECVDHLLADLGTDVDAFIAADGVDVYQGVNETGGTYRYTRLGGLLSGVRALVLADYGEVDEHTEGQFLSETYLATMREVSRDTDQPEARAAHYNYLTSMVWETIPPRVDGDVPFEAKYERGTQTLVWATASERPARAAGILLHEPIHSAEEANHVPCTHPTAYTPDPAGNYCDEDLEGAFGFSVAGLEVLVRSSCHSNEFRYAAWLALRMVNNHSAKDGLTPQALEGLDIVFPDEFIDCGDG
ncbi:MAG: hypothetical protein VX899_17280 [Myxococcota bacterium]|nr:hypothetical protein [Myxococcota bacterium]